MYSKIVLCLREKEDEVLRKQIEMLKERHHAELMMVSADDADDYISNCESEVLFICDDAKLLAVAKDRGLASNDPKKMRESYEKAMEMLKAMGMNGVKK
ncbi:hypothetical protein [Butyrivibrio sp. MC2021]|uniref:hypothetical protein n=1 Tax=Butyrivibrio sp. MC2021 TaxID=1408306 RepID=UPI0004798460|nr:hypothetical protein [Butyrivibrio sp. MC2021]